MLAANPRTLIPTEFRGMEIRKALDSDLSEILEIHKKAFGGEQGIEIANLVDDLLKDETGFPVLSLVAVEGGRAVGHILFTKVSIAGAEKSLSAQILAPYE